VAATAFAAQTPFIVGVVELSHGVRVTAQIVDADPADLEVGTLLRRVLRKVSEEGRAGIIHYAYKFAPARP
jgi:uncharacterized OB-fold protein